MSGKDYIELWDGMTHHNKPKKCKFLKDFPIRTEDSLPVCSNINEIIPQNRLVCLVSWYAILVGISRHYCSTVNQCSLNKIIHSFAGMVMTRMKKVKFENKQIRMVQFSNMIDRSTADYDSIRSTVEAQFSNQ